MKMRDIPQPGVGGETIALSPCPPKLPKTAPPIGTTLYLVREHLYYVPNRAGPMLEYVVCAGNVREFIIGRRAEMKLVLRNAQRGKDRDVPALVDLPGSSKVQKVIHGEPPPLIGRHTEKKLIC